MIEQARVLQIIVESGTTNCFSKRRDIRVKLSSVRGRDLGLSHLMPPTSCSFICLRANSLGEDVLAQCCFAFPLELFYIIDKASIAIDFALVLLNYFLISFLALIFFLIYQFSDFSYICRCFLTLLNTLV